MIDHAFDVLLCALLVATIAHLALVQHRLRAFRAERDRLQAFVTALDLTVERAETAIRRLRNLQAESGVAPPQPETARPVRQRTPEDLLREARRAAGVRGKRGADAAEGGATPKAVAALDDVLGSARGR